MSKKHKHKNKNTNEINKENDKRESLVIEEKDLIKSKPQEESKKEIEELKEIKQDDSDIFKKEIELENKVERIRMLIILLVVIIILGAGIFYAYYIKNNNKEPKKEETTSTTTTKKVDIFKGLSIKEVDFDSDIKYDYESRYEFVYASGEDKKTIYTSKDDLELYYELTLKDGVIILKEQRYVEELKGYEYTGKEYKLTSDTAFTSYLVAETCDNDRYSIIAIDKNNQIYVYTTPEDEYNIRDIVNNFKKVTTITTAKAVGYYNYSNEANVDCKSYTLIYKDSSNNIRTLEKKNPLFFDTAYYRYVGANYRGNVIYVYKDGLMKYQSNTTQNLYDGNYKVYYRGSFYTATSASEDIYIISKDGYLFQIKNFNSDSSLIIKRYTNSKIKKIGTRTMKNDKGFATEKLEIAIEFEDESTLQLEEIYDFELIS